MSGVSAVEVGAVLGRYRLERLLGSGATSEVFIATHLQLERKVAIKVLPPHLPLNDESVQRMVQEARAVNAVSHPNVAEIFDFLEESSPPRVALIMEYVPGPSLEALTDFGWSFEQALGLSLQLVSAVAAAHAAGVIHRDLKPANLLLSSDPRTSSPRLIPKLKLIDFGIAKLAGVGVPTMAGRPLGTPAYMAPEQISGSEPSTTATDVYAIGEIMFELFCGQKAFPQRNSSEVMRAKLRGARPKLILRDGIPELAQPIIADLVYRAIATAQAERPSLPELREALMSLAPWPELSGRESSRLAEVVGHESSDAHPWFEALAPTTAPSLERATVEPAPEPELRGSRKIGRSTVPLKIETSALDAQDLARPAATDLATEVAPLPWTAADTGKLSRLIVEGGEKVSTAETLDSLPALDSAFDDHEPTSPPEVIRAAVLDVLPLRESEPPPSLESAPMIPAMDTALMSQPAPVVPVPSPPKVSMRPHPALQSVERPPVRGASPGLRILAAVLAVTAVFMAGIAVWLKLRSS